MDAAMARKYLSGEVSLDEASQTPSTDTTQTPSEVTSSNGDEDGNNPDDNSQTQLENPEESAGSEDEGTATSTSDETHEETGTENPQETKADPLNNSKPSPKKDSKLPYPKATPKDIKEYKANKAFIKQKQKYQAKVASMQSEIDTLKAQLMKFNSVSEESLADKPSELMDLKINKNTLTNQIQNLERNRNDVIEEQANAEAELIHQQRIDRCFTDEAEVNHYQTLLANGREKFVDFLAKYDPENTVLQYLDDCENSPLLVQVLMTNPNELKRVVEIRSPLNKTIQLKSLENRILMDRRLHKTVGKANPAPAKKLPSTGSQVGAGTGSDKSAVRDSNYWRNYLQTHT